MSTSPSWFDQDKFSRLVKKVGPKSGSATGAPAAPPRPVPKPPAAREAAPAPVPDSALVAPDAPPTPPAPVAPPAPPASEALPVPRTEAAPAPEQEIEDAPAEPVPQPSEPALNLPPPAGELAPKSETPGVEKQRTSPLPNLKPIFEYDKPPARDPSTSQTLQGRPMLTPPTPEMSASESETFGLRDLPAGFLPFEEKEEKGTWVSDTPKSAKAKAETAESDPSSVDLTTAWSTVTSLNEDLSRATGERDEALREGEVLRSQMMEFDDLSKERDELAAQVEDLSRAAEERDDARNEVRLLRAQLLQAEDARTSSPEPSSGPSDELSRTTDERDGARRDYAALREQFETLKQEQVRQRSEPAKKDPALQEELESLRRQVADRDEELEKRDEELRELDKVVKERDEEIKKFQNSPAPAAGAGEADDDLRQEAETLRAQSNQAREEASIAQRGLALSQKALQETRDALREASEGSSMTKTNLQNLKNECAILVQQNTHLQAQHDQLNRELTALKAKLGAA